MDDIVVSVSEFVAVFNQSMQGAFPEVQIRGEVSNFRISKNRWVYMDLKDETAKVSLFGSVHTLPGPLEDGMMVQIKGVPNLHVAFGFSVNFHSLVLSGKGTIKKAAKILEAKLIQEGLFDESRKRLLPYPPKRIGLITSSESAAYSDFVKIIKKRWPLLEIYLVDVKVQGENAVGEVIEALNTLNNNPEMVEVIVITRGGGSLEDLQAFSTESVTRAVSMSRIPTIVAIGHERDVSLAELVADQRASTPSNAAELIVPDISIELKNIGETEKYLFSILKEKLNVYRGRLMIAQDSLSLGIKQFIDDKRQRLQLMSAIIDANDVNKIVNKGFGIIRKDGHVIKSASGVDINDELTIEMKDGRVSSIVERVERNP